MISTDPLFYAVAIPAVLITGVSKSGFGGIALMAVPLMSLVMSPFEAAAITLPLLLMIDAFGVHTWRKEVDWSHLKVLLPGALFGVILGGLTAHMIDENSVKLFVGMIAIGFCLYQFIPRRFNTSDDTLHSSPRWITGSFAGLGAGYTSYIAHAGSPPYHIYIIPKGLNKAAFAATGTYFFAVVNLIKMPAYYLAGQMDWNILLQASVLAPFVPIGVYLGLWLNKRLDHAIFFKVIFAMVFVIGVKLLWESLSVLDIASWWN